MAAIREGMCGISRRDLLRGSAGVAWMPAGAAEEVDRRSVVARHNPWVRAADPLSPLGVGNGRFAFTADVTGLQSFPEFHEKGMPLGTLSDWGWHSYANPEGFRYEETLSDFESHGRHVPYPGREPGAGRAARAWLWYRENPHRLHLGRIGLRLLHDSGETARLAEITDIEQRLDLWSGTLTSRFRLDGREVRVITICHPLLDAIAVRIESKLIAEGRLLVLWAFPYGTGGVTAADWTKPERHTTTLRSSGSNSVELERQLDAHGYRVRIEWQGAAQLRQSARHEFLLEPGVTQSVEFVTCFAPESASGGAERLPAFSATRAAAAAHWQQFWTSGGAVDFSSSLDPRWQTLERRVVLSQYLTAIQCCGENPPQESGLTHNSWYGKFHLEMAAWHGAHFALWGREALLERMFEWYPRTGLAAAKARARSQGYTGARWNKMIDSKARWESPSRVGPFRTTQQGHAIYLPELLYRTHGSRAVLEKYKEVVFESAEFMASFAALIPERRTYVLGPPIISGAEATPPEAMNPALELSYWAFGLTTAQRWRERLGLPRNPQWERVLSRLAPLPVKDGYYIDTESHPAADGRPAVIEMFGCMPGTRVDRRTMERTYLKLKPRLRNPDNVWGCDFPMFAMCAARLGRRGEAVDALLQENKRNTYLPNGHMMQGPALPVYLPANGGLLWAVALMAAGWEGGPGTPAPGFPEDGSWTVKQAGLRAAL